MLRTPDNAPMTTERSPRPVATAAAVLAFVAVGFAFTRAAASWRLYRQFALSDPSVAGLLLDGAELWCGAGFVALVIGTAAALLAIRRK